MTTNNEMPLEIFQAMKFLNDESGLRWEKQNFSPSEQLAIILLRPFLPVIGGRMMQIIDEALKAQEKK